MTGNQLSADDDVKDQLETATIGLLGVRGILADLLSLKPGLLSAVLAQRAAAIIEEHIDPAVEKVGELAALTEEAAGSAFLRQLGDRLDDLQRTGADIATLLEAAFGASLGGEVEAIRKTVGTMTRQVSEVTASLHHRVEDLPDPEQV